MATDQDMKAGVDKEDGNEPDNEMQSFIDDMLGGVTDEIVPEVASDEKESEKEEVVEPKPEAKAAESEEDDRSEEDQQKPEKEREEEAEGKVTPEKEPEPELEAKKSEESDSAQEQLSAEQIQERILGVRDALAKGYQVSQEDADAISTEPQKVIPKLLANVHLQVLQQVSQMLGNVLPQQITTVQAQHQAREKLKSEFLDMWPTLKDAKMEELQSAVGVVRKIVGKDASREDILKRVGNTVFALRGQEAPKPAAKEEKQEGKKPTPSRKSKPHAPVQGKGQDPKPQPKNEQEAFFAEMAAISPRRKRG